MKVMLRVLVCGLVFLNSMVHGSEFFRSRTSSLSSVESTDAESTSLALPKVLKRYVDDSVLTSEVPGILVGKLGDLFELALTESEKGYVLRCYCSSLERPDVLLCQWVNEEKHPLLQRRRYLVMSILLFYKEHFHPELCCFKAMEKQREGSLIYSFLYSFKGVPRSKVGRTKITKEFLYAKLSKRQSERGDGNFIHKWLFPLIRQSEAVAKIVPFLGFSILFKAALFEALSELESEFCCAHFVWIRDMFLS